jgi:hypothetical protein
MSFLEAPILESASVTAAALPVTSPATKGHLLMN